MSQVERLTRDGVVAIVRLDDLSSAVALTEALLAGGVSTLEFTYTNPLAGEVISEVRAAVGDRAIIGAGTVLDPETARLAILAGAEFIVTPALRPATIELCRRYSVPAVVGAFTPTEILTAWEAGADIVKVFPASVGGPRYLKDVKGPLPQVKLIPTGGVSVETAADFIKAGAEAIAAGSNLVDAKSVANADWSTITNRARELADIVAAARAGK
ncbi:MAG: bifunctional 4-hydroxy-2-oxoglutarate aldolase/2-dehydro-3-deoxy-phosphogluconate aldolase [Thermomicrobiales bacterium]|nr:bifunctional 4-hydroxy-2-oxoglutarate aldolase/2-dehydro-3-deoxy-phosphogluconate aldolase [Thermomicrobiales bacterium]